MAFSTYKQQGHAYTPEIRLPPISETSGSQTSTSSSPRSSKTSKSRDNENPFRRNSRRISIFTNKPSISTSSDTVSMLKPPSVTPTQRRRSFDQRKRSVSIDLSTSEEIIKKLQQRRKSSILNIMPDGRRASFGTFGARVATIIRAKNAFTMLAKKRKAANVDAEENNEEYEIGELPPQPRFASTLSAEAQYAVMKGYEDVVHSYLCRQYPEYRTLLRRSQTPHTGITVKAMKDKFENKYASEKAGTSDEPDNINKIADDNAVDNVDAEEPVSTSTPKPDNNLATYLRQTLDHSPVPSLNAKNISKRTTHSFSTFPRKSSSSSDACSDMKAFPEVEQYKERQLVMTYRYQSVMDILDSLREHQGMHALSPRKKDDRRIEPLKDFNSWSRAWTREFEPKICMKTL